MNINFSNKEMREFLAKKGYLFSVARVYQMHSVYHNQTEIEYMNIEIVYKDNEIDNDIFNVEKDKRDIESKYGLDAVFNKEIKQAILNL